MVSCNIVASNQNNSLIGAYLPTSTLDYLPDLEEFSDRFFGRDPVVLGDLNADIDHLRNPRNQHVAYFLEYFGLVELLDNF